MKKVFIILMLAVCCFACKEDKDKNKVKGTAGIPVMATNSTVSKILQTNIWMIEYYVSSTDFEGGKANRGRWYIFKPDGTFQSGYWEEKTGAGSWYLTEEGRQYPLVTIDSFNDAEDAAWEIQGIPADPSEMSWVGAQGYANYGDVIKMLNLLTPPTKKQFGDE